MDSKGLLAISLLFILISIAARTTAPPGKNINPATISVPLFANNYVIKTTVVNGETATVYYTSYSPTRGTYMTITIYPHATVTTRTIYWYSNGKWYYVTGAILESTSTLPFNHIITINLRLENNVLVLISDGKTYTPTGTPAKHISNFTIITGNTTIEYTIYSANYVPLST